MLKTIASYARGGLAALYRREPESGAVELLLVPEGWQSKVVRQDCAAAPLVQAKLAQDDMPPGFSGGRTLQNGPATLALAYAGQSARQAQGSLTVETVLNDPRGLRAVHTLTLFDENPAAEIVTRYENNSGEPVTLELLTSFTLGSLSPFAEGLAPGTLRIHRMRANWSAEGRLVTENAEDLQLEPSWSCHSVNSLRFGCVGNYPVQGFVPFCAVEDTAHGVTWAAATTQGYSWQMELTRQDMGLRFAGGLADREFGQWWKTLAPGESFTAPKAVVTAVAAGVDRAAEVLAENTRRAIEPALPPAERGLPVLFNEFCATWGEPTEASVLAQLAALKGRGVGVYVIDAGWFDEDPFSDETRLGRWEVSRKAFPHGLAPVAQAVHAAGMQLGIWFEFEVVSRGEPDCFNKTDWQLKRDGRPITVGCRRFWDFREPAVVDYLAGRVIEFLRREGIDYIKIDYNEATGPGCDGAESPGEALRAHLEAVRAFYARLRRELPGVTLELCASGGHRLCHSFLELSCMASFSDAHECDEIPIIAANMHRILLPRQSQIWAVVRPEQPLQKLYYQMCSALLGRLCLSGYAETFRPEQWAVIGQAIEFYRAAAPVIDRGRSRRYGPAVLSYRAPAGWQAVVRRGERQTLVVVHTFAGAPESIALPAAGKIARAFLHPGVAAGAQNGGVTLTGLRDFDAAALLLDHETAGEGCVC